MAEEERDVITELGLKGRCGKAKGTALVCFTNEGAWSRCVRAPNHEGECVLGLTAMEQKVLDGTHEPHWMMMRDMADEQYWVWLRDKQRVADAAWGT
jgi:hypothetical protein